MKRNNQIIKTRSGRHDNKIECSNKIQKVETELKDIERR